MYSCKVYSLRLYVKEFNIEKGFTCLLHIGEKKGKRYNSNAYYSMTKIYFRKNVRYAIMVYMLGCRESICICSICISLTAIYTYCIMQEGLYNIYQCFIPMSLLLTYFIRKYIQPKYR